MMKCNENLVNFKNRSFLLYDTCIQTSLNCPEFFTNTKIVQTKENADTFWMKCTQVYMYLY